MTSTRLHHRKGDVMRAKVRSGYGYTRGSDNYAPGATIELTDAEYKAKHQIFELIGKEEEDGKSKKATKEETEEKSE